MNASWLLFFCRRNVKDTKTIPKTVEWWYNSTWAVAWRLEQSFIIETTPLPFFYIDLSASFWQTERIDFLHSDDRPARAISSGGEEAYAHILSERPRFTSDYYEGYRFSTPLYHLTFRIIVGANF